MGSYRDKLVDATKRLLQVGTSEDDAVKSMVEVGIGPKDAKSVLKGAKKLLAKEPEEKRRLPVSTEDFWDAPVGTYFGNLPQQDAEAHKKVLSFFKWLIR